MEMPKPTEQDKSRFTALVPDEDPRVTVRPMFGNLGAFVNGNMFMGLFGSSVGLKLDEVDRSALHEVEGTAPFGPAERPMGGYVSLPAAWVETPDGQVSGWVDRALAHVGAMPPKRPKVKKGT